MKVEKTLVQAFACLQLSTLTRAYDIDNFCFALEEHEGDDQSVKRRSGGHKWLINNGQLGISV
jgi:hypothetical protein